MNRTNFGKSQVSLMPDSKQPKRSGEILGKKSQQKLNHTSPKKYFKTLSQFT
jgi:hypothetical protein